jgi:hypothetical protein
MSEEQITQQDIEDAERLLEHTSGPSEPVEHLVGDQGVVYSLRLPASTVAELRRLARERHKAPSALMRDWVIERLADERNVITFDEYNVSKFYKFQSKFKVFGFDEAEVAATTQKAVSEQFEWFLNRPQPKNMPST